MQITTYLPILSEKEDRGACVYQWIHGFLGVQGRIAMEWWHGIPDARGSVDAGEGLGPCAAIRRVLSPGAPEVWERCRVIVLCAKTGGRE